MSLRDLGRQERIDASLSWIERYQPLIDDRHAFRAALGERPPVDLLIPPTRRSLEQIESLLDRRGIAHQRFAFAPQHLRAISNEGAGTMPEVVLGFCHPQGVSSALPVLALQPQAGETVLDLCAAPGGKTLYAALLASDRARLVAGDISVGRTGPLVQTLARHAVSSTTVVAGDSSALPVLGTIDAILLDAPCSGEGTFRIPVPRFDPPAEHQLARSPAIQQRLLDRAMQLLRPGGRLVYSTCAYAPEENEAVLSQALAARDDFDLVSLPASFPGIPALTTWREQRFDPRLTRARRILPHHTGSWGFFVALLVKDPHSTRVAREKRREVVGEAPVDRGDVLRRVFGDQFGVPLELLAEYRATERGRDLWIEPREIPPVRFDSSRVVARGLRAVHLTKTGPRPTTSALRLFGPAITQRAIELPFEAAARFLRGESIAAPAELTRRPHALRVAGQVVGSVSNEDGACQLHIPGGWR
jgi:16S rRNA C967 or C1407 C5-methylase (RsmB/RsmF family)/NOL1/NOP2/fmu family ribosome biogenesis protein